MLALPLPMLLGSILSVGAVAVAGLRPLGHLPAVPGIFRTLSVPVIGVSIGGAFDPAILEQAGGWWPSLLALFLYIPSALGIGYVIYRRFGHVDGETAFYGAVPGGLITAIAMGEEAGADIQMTTMLQFLRLIFCIIIVPLGFTILTGGAVGSAAGAVIGGAGHVPGLRDIVILIAAGGIGLWLGTLAQLPAAQITGPLLASGVVHLLGWTQAAVPFWLIAVTQLLIGTGLGARFAGLAKRSFLKAVVLAFANVVTLLILGLGFAFALHRVIDEPVEAVVLAFAPGGVAEMSLVAVSLKISVIYVTAHHVLRIVLAVTAARIFSRREARNT